jgi:hypothetical protein
MRLYLRPSQESIELTHALSISTSNFAFPSEDLLKPDLAFIQHPNARSSGWKIELNKMNLNHFKNVSYLDLGEFEGYDSIEMAQTTAFLLEKGIVPIIIGADEQYYQSIAAYFQNKIQPFTVSCIKPGASHADLDTWDNLLTLKDLYFIGLQRHLTDLTQAGELGLRSHFTYLSELRKSTLNAEPWLRRSDIIIFDPTTIRRSDFPAINHFLPSGLFSEEAASLARMAGSSERNLLFITQKWESGYSEESTTCDFGIAQLLWYFIEGFAMKKMDQENQMRAITEYIVDAEDLKSEICFCKSELTGKWWFRDPQSLGENKTALIPCTYEEYLQTINSHTPERISLIFRQNTLQSY